MTGTRQVVKARLAELLALPTRTKEEKREIFTLQTRLYELRQTAPDEVSVESEVEDSADEDAENEIEDDDESVEAAQF